MSDPDTDEDELLADIDGQMEAIRLLRQRLLKLVRNWR